MGESFYAINPNIINQLHKNARAANVLTMSEKYRSYAVSGQLLTGTIPGQFDRALADGPVKVVIMDGGGNDWYPLHGARMARRRRVAAQYARGEQRAFTRGPRPAAGSRVQRQAEHR